MGYENINAGEEATTWLSFMILFPARNFRMMVSEYVKEEGSDNLRRCKKTRTFAVQNLNLLLSYDLEKLCLFLKNTLGTSGKKAMVQEIESNRLLISVNHPDFFQKHNKIWAM
jgi:hypothetical protein